MRHSAPHIGGVGYAPYPHAARSSGYWLVQTSFTSPPSTCCARVVLGLVTLYLEACPEASPCFLPPVNWCHGSPTLLHLPCSLNPLVGFLVSWLPGLCFYLATRFYVWAPYWCCPHLTYQHRVVYFFEFTSRPSYPLLPYPSSQLLLLPAY